MRKRSVTPAMRRSEVEGFPKDIKDLTLDWEVSARSGAVQFSFHIPGHTKPIEFALMPEDAYELHADIGRGYDQANGIG